MLESALIANEELQSFIEEENQKKNALLTLFLQD